jgi:hypothetical protein
MKTKPFGAVTSMANVALATALLLGQQDENHSAASFPARLPPAKPADRPLSAAMQRLYEVWNPHEDRGNELYGNFKYSRLEGLSREPNVSRRDPSKVVRINGTYYVWYTCRRTAGPPAGPANATDTVPSFDWDLAEIWYAASRDGFQWQERGPAVRRPAKGRFGWRSNCTPDILLWRGKYYLYHQAYSEIIQGGDACPVTLAVADSPDGPWRPLGRPVLEPSEAGAWDGACIHDPFPLVYRGKVYLYYKGQPRKPIDRDTMIRAQGVAMADRPEGPFQKSLVQIPPIAPGPFVPDAFADNADGRGFTWGLCHINPDGGGGMSESILARFDCDLSLDVDRPQFKRNNLRFDEATYFQRLLALPDPMRSMILKEQRRLETDTVTGGGVDREP